MRTMTNIAGLLINVRRGIEKNFSFVKSDIRKNRPEEGGLIVSVFASFCGAWIPLPAFLRNARGG